jgi:hypothetical protein
MAKSKRKRVPKTVLRLPDLEQSKSAGAGFVLMIGVAGNRTRWPTSQE